MFSPEKKTFFNSSLSEIIILGYFSVHYHHLLSYGSKCLAGEPASTFLLKEWPWADGAPSFFPLIVLETWRWWDQHFGFFFSSDFSHILFNSFNLWVFRLPYYLQILFYLSKSSAGKGLIISKENIWNDNSFEGWFPSEYAKCIIKV